LKFHIFASAELQNKSIRNYLGIKMTNQLIDQKMLTKQLSSIDEKLKNKNLSIENRKKLKMEKKETKLILSIC
jgi:hypothetical protein